MSKWILTMKKADFAAWGKELGVDQVLARVVRNRGMETLEQARSYLYGGLETLHSPWLLPDMEGAVLSLLRALHNREKIRVMGDYDVDGVTSAYILERALKLLGADVDVAIPHRVLDGYGLNDRLVEESARDGVDLILTCENGIAAASQAERAYELGMRMIITDHHEVPYDTLEDGSHRQKLPRAEAVVDPKREDCTYPFREICGAEVAYKLVLALIERLESTEQSETSGQLRQHLPALRGEMEDLLIMASLGCVCDVMPLQDENRALVKAGMEALKTTDHPGLRALMDVCGVSPEKISAYTYGFVIGPCINAAGRLDSAMMALDLLRSENYEKAVEMATRLRDYNDTRKRLTQEGTEQAEHYIEEHGLMQQAVWLIYLPEVHESIAGIIAGRIKERFHHPVFLLTRGEEAVKGSGRSIPAYHMYDHMVEVEEFFTKYGGHAMAAGLSMEEDRIEDLRIALNERADLKPEDFEGELRIDVPMPLSYANLTLAKQMAMLEPCGTGNPGAVFAQKDVFLTGCSRFGAAKQYLRFRADLQPGTASLTYFGNGEDFKALLESRFGEGALEQLEKGNGRYSLNVAYRISENIYRGESSLEYNVIEFS